MTQQPPLPAPAGGGAANHPSLHMPALAPALFLTLYVDANLDPTGGDPPSRLLSPFFHDTDNPMSNATTQTFQNGLFTSGAKRQLIAAAIIIGNNVRI